MSEAVDMTETISPRSDQQNFDDYSTGPRTVTITEVRRGSSEQPIEIHLAEYPDRPYKPSKSMRRVLVYAWGADASAYHGRRLRLYGDPDVKFGGQTTGGIKISHLSHIDKRLTIALTETRGKRKPHTVDPLKDEPTQKPTAPKAPTAAGIIAAFDAMGVTVEQLEKRLGLAHDGWDATHLETLAALGKAIKAGESTVWEEFDGEKPEAVEAEQGTLG